MEHAGSQISKCKDSVTGVLLYVGQIYPGLVFRFLVRGPVLYDDDVVRSAPAPTATAHSATRSPPTLSPSELKAFNAFRLHPHRGGKVVNP